MKKIILSALLSVMAFGMQTGAQERRETRASANDFPRYELSVGWAGYPMDFPIYLPFVKYYHDYDVMVDMSLSSMYSDYSGPIYSTGVISAEFAYNFKKWFALTAQLGYQGLFADNFSAGSDVKTSVSNGYILTFMPQARFTFFHRPMVRLYSSLGIGVVGAAFRGDDEVSVAAHLTAFGVSFGKKVYGKCELGIRTDYMGAMIGLGYRF